MPVVIPAAGGFALGMVRFAISQGQRSPEAWGELLSEKIVSVGPEVPQPMRDQAEAYKDQITKACGNYIRMAVEEERAYLAAELERLGMKEAAALVRERK